jgi:hypothetical protein
MRPHGGVRPGLALAQRAGARLWRHLRRLLAGGVCGRWHSTHILGCCEEWANPPGAVGAAGGSLSAMIAASVWGVLGVMVA